MTTTGQASEPAAKAALWPVFAAKAQALGTTMLRVAGQEGAVRLLTGQAGMVATTGLAAHLPGITPAPTARPGGAAGPEVAGLGSLAVAETGSVLLAEAAPDRGACFLADRLWLIVPAGAIVATLDEALTHLAALVRAGLPYATFISGPSRTADIERTLTIGVHGPRALNVVVVDDWPATPPAGAAPGDRR